MKGYHRLLPGTLLLGALSCAEPKFAFMRAQHRGSEEFKTSLDISNGSNHPAIPTVMTALQLTASDPNIHSLTMDPAANVWASVLFDVSRQPVIQSEITEWSRNYIATHQEELGLDAAELSVIPKTLYEPFPNQSYVTFQRQYQGREVRGAFVQLIFAHDAAGYRLQEILNKSYGPIDLSAEPAASAVTAQAAIDATGIPSLEPIGQKPLIYPQLAADGRYEFRLGTEWELSDGEAGERFKVIVDDNSQSILAASSNHLHAKQTLQIESFKNSYIDKTLNVGPMGFAKVDAAVADANGVLDTSATQGTLSLSGVQGSIVNAGNRTLPTTVNALLAMPLYTVPLTFAANGPTKIAASTAVDAAAVNAYAALLEVHRWVSQFLTPQEAPVLNKNLITRVNVLGNTQLGQDPYCNAFYLSPVSAQDMGSLNFFAQGAVGNTTCANTALIKDVMYHEWGHALDDTVGIQAGLTDGAFSEGIGDINSILATNNPILGIGFVLNDPNSKVRTTDNTRMYTQPMSAADAEVHRQGEIIGGTFWDLRQNLVALYGTEEGVNRTSKLFYKHLLVTDFYINSYNSVLRLDDDDNNPATQSPSFCAITKAFGKHALLPTGQTVPANCVDQDQGLKVRVDVDNGNGSLNLIASSFGASSIVFCEGKVTSCPASATRFVQQEQTGSNLVGNAKKKFYVAGATVSVEPSKMYTLVSLNAEGQALGVKTLSFGKRSQASDLSRTLQVK